MPNRLDVELTSTRPDGSWTWRAAGAKQPKGELDGSLLFEGAAVGDVVKVEAEMHLDGIEITTVFPPKGARKEPELLEILGSGRDEPLVTSRLVERRERKGRGRGDRKRGDGRDGGRGRGRGERERKPRAERPKPPPRPKAPRLRPKRAHRNEALAALPAEQQPIADQLLRGGIPSVRQAIDKQNEAARAAGEPEVPPQLLLGLAEQIYPALRAAEWRDRAEAALAGIETIDLRDIRSVVSASDSNAKGDDARELAAKLRDGLTTRVEADHNGWVKELQETVAEGRTVRALRLSSRPPKAGAPLPKELADTLAAQASEGLTSEISQERWATVLDAVAYSPVRQQVTPGSLPDKPGDELLATVTKLASRIPHIASGFGIEAAAKPRKRARKAPPPPKPTAQPPAASTAADPQPSTPDAAEAADDPTPEASDG